VRIYFCLNFLKSCVCENWSEWKYLIVQYVCCVTHGGIMLVGFVACCNGFWLAGVRMSFTWFLCSPKDFGGAYSRRLVCLSVRQSVSPSVCQSVSPSVRPYDSCPANNFVIWSRISKLFYRNDHHIDTTCRAQHLGPYLEGQGHSATLQQNRVRPITLLFEVRFQKICTEMITILIRRVAYNIWVPTLKIKVTARPCSKIMSSQKLFYLKSDFETISQKWSLYWDDVSHTTFGLLLLRSRSQHDIAAKSCPAHNFVILCQISKIFHRNDYHIDTTCRAQHLGCYLEGQGHSATLQQNRVRPITLLFEVGFRKYFTEMITILRRRVAFNIWVATLKVKVTAWPCSKIVSGP